jgi:LuxR family maltose regulon positive regulatory protein
LVSGNSQIALDWLERKGITTAKPPADIHDMELFALCRALIAAGRPQETIPLLDQILTAARERGHISKTLEVLLVSAQAHDGCGNHDQTIKFIKEALSLASDHGFFRTVINEGPAMARLLYSAVEKNIQPEFASELIAAFPIDKQQRLADTETDKKVSPLVEPLSTREVEVLELLSQGHTNQKIAEVLFLSLNTVKSHARSIYGKLDVNNRTQAVSKARSLGLISSS